MNLLNKYIINNILLAGGFFLYLYCLISQQFVISIICLFLILIIWVFIQLFLNNYSNSVFFQLLSVCSILLSFSVLFFHGIEEVPYPEGAIIFHSEGIAQFLILFFISLIPILILKDSWIHKLFQQKQKINKVQQKEHESLKPTIIDDADEWERASYDDLSSENYEIIK